MDWSQIRNVKMPESMMLEVPSGWEAVVQKALSRLSSLDEAIEILQVKEKLGGLRIYYAPCSDRADEIIRDAELECSRTCDTCGQPGTRVQGTWIRVLCDTHRKRFENDDD